MARGQKRVKLMFFIVGNLSMEEKNVKYKLVESHGKEFSSPFDLALY
jgi:hypothetical protein